MISSGTRPANKLHNQSSSSSTITSSPVSSDAAVYRAIQPKSSSVLVVCAGVIVASRGKVATLR